MVPLDEIGIRCFVETEEEPSEKKPWRDTPSPSAILVFDTETTDDQYQNLLFGSYILVINGREKECGLFHHDNLDEARLQVLRDYGKAHNIKVMSRAEFVKDVFLMWTYWGHAKCVGFNLPFDLSRLAIEFGPARGDFKNGFSLRLFESDFHPRIAIKQLNLKRAFIKYRLPGTKEPKEKVKGKHYNGYFLDLHTFLFAITDKSYTLEKALEEFNCTHQKMSIDEYGIVNPKSIRYNLNDTRSTYELYEKALERYKLFGLDLEPNRLYSPASIGKAFHEKIGICSFLYKNPKFDRHVLGYVMSTYYGGRSEVRIRKDPRKITYIDYTSMYPTVYALMGMDDLLKADKITHRGDEENTRRVQDLLDNLIYHINQPEKWPGFKTMCKFKPSQDLVPVRSKYDGKTYNIGDSYLTLADTSMWYTLPDVIADIIRTGQVPRLEQAITFEAQGIQTGLKDIEILPSIPCNQNEDFVRKLIEIRAQKKKERNTYPKNIKVTAEDGTEKEVQNPLWTKLDIEQNILKIIANATSYGIFIEINTSDTEEQMVKAYCLDATTQVVSKTESVGKAFNPIIAVFLTAGARLILAMAETLALAQNGYYVCCDTDSIFVKPSNTKAIQEFFRQLNPYDKNLAHLFKEMFKVEEDEKERKLEEVYCYGISAKRYALYDHDPATNKVNLRKFTTHGLGENILGLDQKKVWEDTLDVEYKNKTEEEVLEYYSERYTMSQFTITSYDILKRFKTYNQDKQTKQDKPLDQQIKPYNFIITGIGFRNRKKGEKIIPMVPYVSPKKNPDAFNNIPFGKFIDFKTGAVYPNKDSEDSEFYWKPLDKFVENFMHHKESKSKGSDAEQKGVLERKELFSCQNKIRKVGKETNDLDRNQAHGTDPDSYTDYTTQLDLYLKILNMTSSEAEECGISESWLYKAKKMIREDKQPPISKKTLKKLRG